MIGTMLSHYRITEKLGAGGMGEVYRAEDTNLDRQVAIKVLPDIFSGDPERLARFEREAKLLASLNHSNIATIYGLEQADGKRFLAMELVEGETLAQRIAKGPLPVDETLDVCRQIAEGLEAAHEKGVIHRDLKPANVKVTSEGKVKILDFGLAKAMQDEIPAVDASKSPTITEAMTRPGVIMGTAAYMSPEQAKGKTVDKRADIWAFGCVLYECLTGKRAFQGDTITEIVASILKSEPDWTVLPVETPAIVRSLLRQCLQKDPRERLRDIGDVRIEIRESSAQPAEGVSGSRHFPSRWIVACMALTLLVGMLIGFALRRYPQPAISFPVVRSVIKAESGHWLAGMQRAGELQRPSRTAMAISADGRFVVYSAIEENPGPQAKPQLYLRRMDQVEGRPITGTEGGINPFLSPDNRWVGFWADGKLKKILVEGGVATELCNALDMFGADWGADNRIVFADVSAGGLSLISSEGGKPEPLTKPDPKREEMSHRLPSWLPNGKAVLFTVMRHGFDSQPWIALLRLDTREWHVLLEDAADARYVPTGHLVFLKRGTLMAVRFDSAKLEVIGQPSPIMGNVLQGFSANSNYNTEAGQFDISGSGTLVYAAGGLLPDAMNSLVWVDQSGSEQAVSLLKRPFNFPRLSPDGKRIAYVTSGLRWQVYVYDLSTGSDRPLTDEGRATFPIWTPDGKQIVFGWQKSLVTNLFSEPYDGSSQMKRLTTSEHAQYPSSWSSDGRSLAVVETAPDSRPKIPLMEVSSVLMRPFLNSKSGAYHPDFSPNSPWIAYVSEESGRQEVYITSCPMPGGKHQVSNQGGIAPLWARGGKQLFYQSIDGTQMWVVDVRTDGEPWTSKPRLLFERSGYVGGIPVRGYDLSLDGQRFLMVKTEPRKPTPVTEMILVQNWFEELKHLVPTGK